MEPDPQGFAWLEAPVALAAWSDSLTVIGLLAVRLFVLFRLQPHWASLMGNAWWVCSLGFAVVLAVAVGPEAVAGTGAGSGLGELGALGLVALIVTEALVGAVIGVLASLPAYGLMAACAGSAAALGTAPRPFVALGLAFAGCVALLLGLHHPGLRVLADQAVALPPGRPALWAVHAGDIIPWSTAGLDGMLVLALTLATPVLLTVVVLRFSLAAVAGGPRESGSLAHTTSATVASLAAMLALGAAWSVYPEAWARAAAPSTQRPSPFWQVQAAGPPPGRP